MIGDDAVIEAELKGKTLLVYMYLIKSKDPAVGVREVQRALGFSSPSVSYHNTVVGTAPRNRVVTYWRVGLKGN